MILADTAIWVDHFRSRNQELGDLLRSERIVMHPFVCGEIACGYLKNRDEELELLGKLPQLRTVTDTEALYFIEYNRIAGRGIGYVDVHLLAATAVTPGALIWTFDRRLRTIASELELAYCQS